MKSAALSKAGMSQSCDILSASQAMDIPPELGQNPQPEVARERSDRP
jgi:hypothetical protein